MMRRHGKMVGLGPPLGKLATGSYQVLGQARTEDRRAAPLPNVAQQGRPLFQPAAAFGKPRCVPQPPTLQPHKEHRHPPVGALPHPTSRHGHRPVDQPIPLQLTEKDGHELGDRLHGYIALHGQHSRDASLGQARPQRRQSSSIVRAGLVVRASAVAPPCALARCQNHQARALLHLP